MAKSGGQKLKVFSKMLSPNVFVGDPIRDFRLRRAGMTNVLLDVLNHLKQKGGFTLPEVILATGLLISLFLLVGILFQRGTNLMDVTSAQSDLQRNARRTVHSISTSLRQARRSAIVIPVPPANNTISFDMPVYQASLGVCSALAPVASGTLPVSCTTNPDCAIACTDGFCSQGVCRRTYTYSRSQSNGIGQVILSAPLESNRAIANNINSLVFQDNTMDTNLRPSEIRVTTGLSGDVVSEKRAHGLVATAIVQVRN